jgi:hypothetical protein
MALRVVPDSSGPGSSGVIEELGKLQLRPSLLRPDVDADQRIFAWRGALSTPTSARGIPALRHIADLASRASLKDAGGYGAGLRKFHLFCDIFDIPEEDRLPASYDTLFAFVLWACTTPDTNEPVFADRTPYEPVAIVTARKYLSAVRAWHLAQGWPAPLSSNDHERMGFTLRGLERIEAGRRSQPPRPPITLPMLAALRYGLNLSDPFDAAVWAICSCAFWGLMRSGEVTVKTRGSFDGAKHAKRADARFGRNQLGQPYVRISLPTAKTAAIGRSQDVFITRHEGPLCALSALENLARTVPAGDAAPLFSWSDRHGMVHPMIPGTVLGRIREVLSAYGWSASFGHSFRIGGASHLLAQGVDPELVRLQGRWKSLAYETYIRAFEQVLSRHVGGSRTLSG